jgi:hypothetical protein
MAAAPPARHEESDAVTDAERRFDLKALPPEAVPDALAMADRYRLLGEPGEAESICRDVLASDPDNQRALITLALALTDQFGRGLGQRCEEALALTGRLHDDYSRAYYAGVVCERRGKAHHRQATPGCGTLAYEWLRRAMDWFERAERARPQGGAEALLRYNACVRHLTRYKDIHPHPEPDAPTMLE